MQYSFASLEGFASQILQSAGLDGGHADVAGKRLVMADAMGHHTHGLAYLPIYVKALKSGVLTPAGEPDTLKDTGPILAWHGKRLSGIWLVDKAVKLACGRAQKFGLCVMTIREAHHTGCLASFLPYIAQAGLLGYIAVSGPAGRAVVPFGGLAGYGRADQPSGSQTNVYIQITDPEAFAGLEAFKRQTTYLVSACQASEPIDAAKPVRLPGMAAMKGLKKAGEHGVLLSRNIIEILETMAHDHRVDLPPNI